MLTRNGATGTALSLSQRGDLDMSGSERAALGKQSQGRRIGPMEELRREVAAWEGERHGRQDEAHPLFTTSMARVKLRSLRP